MTRIRSSSTFLAAQREDRRRRRRCHRRTPERSGRRPSTDRELARQAEDSRQGDWPAGDRAGARGGRTRARHAGRVRSIPGGWPAGVRCTRGRAAGGSDRAPQALGRRGVVRASRQARPGRPHARHSRRQASPASKCFIPTTMQRRLRSTPAWRKALNLHTDGRIGLSRPQQRTGRMPWSGRPRRGGVRRLWSRARNAAAEPARRDRDTAHRAARRRQGVSGAAPAADCASS